MHRPLIGAEMASGVIAFAICAELIPGGGLSIAGPGALPCQWFQDQTLNHQNWRRDYDPTTGRYLQPDPLGLIDGPAVYNYALSNTLKYYDKDGREVEAWYKSGEPTTGQNTA